MNKLFVKYCLFLYVFVLGNCCHLFASTTNFVQIETTHSNFNNYPALTCFNLKADQEHVSDSKKSILSLLELLFNILEEEEEEEESVSLKKLLQIQYYTYSFYIDKYNICNIEADQSNLYSGKLFPTSFHRPLYLVVCVFKI